MRWFLILFGMTVGWWGVVVVVLCFWSFPLVQRFSRWMGPDLVRVLVPVGAGSGHRKGEAGLVEGPVEELEEGEEELSDLVTSAGWRSSSGPGSGRIGGIGWVGVVEWIW